MNPNSPPPYPPYSRPGMPPVPRDHDGASFSEIIPLGSSKINLAKSPATLLLILAAIIAPLTLVFVRSMQGAGLQRGFLNLSFSTVFFVTFALALIVYLYARPGRSLLPFLWAFALVCGMLTLYLFNIPFIFDAISFLFVDVLGGAPARAGPNVSFGWAFTSHFMGAGLVEELFKAIPIFIGLAFGLAARHKPEGEVGPFQRFFRIRGPLDGVVMGAFAGAGFILIETAGLYLPHTFQQGLEVGSADEALGAALFLYFPRVIGGAVGHIAYSGIFGYFIGLALLRPRLGILLIVGGWLLASALHGLWNGLGVVARADTDVYYLMIPALLSALFFAAMLLKARQLHASRYGNAPDTLGSIVIDRSAAAAAYPPAPYGGMPPQPGAFPAYPPAPQPFAPVQPPSFAPPAFAAPPPPAAIEQALAIEIDGVTIPLREGLNIDLGAEPALAGKGAGVLAQVVPHPRRPGVLGIRNAGDGPWTAHLRDGRDQQIDKSQNVRLAPGVRIDFGDGLVGEVRTRPT